MFVFVLAGEIETFDVPSFEESLAATLNISETQVSVLLPLLDGSVIARTLISEAPGRAVLLEDIESRLGALGTDGLSTGLNMSVLSFTKQEGSSSPGADLPSAGDDDDDDDDDGGGNDRGPGADSSSVSADPVSQWLLANFTPMQLGLYFGAPCVAVCLCACAALAFCRWRRGKALRDEADDDGADRATESPRPKGPRIRWGSGEGRGDAPLLSLGGISSRAGPAQLDTERFGPGASEAAAQAANYDYDVFLSHGARRALYTRAEWSRSTAHVPLPIHRRPTRVAEWGVFYINHNKVGKVNQALKLRGIRTWFDEDQGLVRPERDDPLLRSRAREAGARAHPRLPAAPYLPPPLLACSRGAVWRHARRCQERNRALVARDRLRDQAILREGRR